MLKLQNLDTKFDMRKTIKWTPKVKENYGQRWLLGALNAKCKVSIKTKDLGYNHNHNHNSKHNIK